MKALRGHIRQRATHLLVEQQRARRVCYRHYTKVGEQQGLISTEQHVFWLYIAVDQAVLMQILQGSDQRPDIADHGGQRNACAFGMSLSERPTGNVLHHKVWDPLSTDPKIQHRDNMGMRELNHASFLNEGREGMQS